MSETSTFSGWTCTLNQVAIDAFTQATSPVCDKNKAQVV